MLKSNKFKEKKTISLPVPRLRRLIAGLLQSSHRFDSKPLHVRFGGNRSTEAGFYLGASASPLTITPKMLNIL